MWASVYIDAAAAGVYIGVITGVVAGVNGSIGIDINRAAGAAPTTSATTRSITVGGAGAGPTGAVDYPLNLANLKRLTNGAGIMPFFNWKNNADYKITANIDSTAAGPFGMAGYTTTPRDGGKATVDGNTAAAAFNVFTISGGSVYVGDLIISSNGNSSSAGSAITPSGVNTVIERVVAKDIRGSGIFSGGTTIVIDCEAYGCGVGGGVSDGGFRNNNAHVDYIRCISHDNTTATCSGWYVGSLGVTLNNCIADSNGTNGVTLDQSTGQTSLVGVDLYNNGGHGVQIKTSAGTSVSLNMVNVNLFKNTQWGVFLASGMTNVLGVINNLAFGAGTEANGAGTISTATLGGLIVRDSTMTTYPANTNPWADAPNGDFDISNVLGWGTGRGTYTQTAPSYSGTLAYPDIGAVQHRGITNTVAGAFFQ
jgi:hypothetical protein